MKSACCTKPSSPCVFLGRMRLAFTMTVNSYDTRPTAPGFRFFFQLKRASRKPFQIPCVILSKTRLAFNVTVNLYDAQPTAPTTFVFQRKCASQESCHIPRVHCHFDFSGQCVLGSQVNVNSHVMLPAPAGCRFFFQRKTRLAGIAGKFQSWNKGIC